MRYLLIVLLLSSSVRAQPLTQTQKLASLAKIWGFFKYYHPAVATGKLDWDGQLLRLIPAVEKAQDRQQLSALYQTLLQELGPVKPCRKCLTQAALSANVRQNLDLSFLADSLVLTSTLRDQLNYLKDNRYQGDNSYAKLELAGNLSFENEKVYANITQLDTNFRLLTLFRYWNIIHYFFPYKYAIDAKWDQVLIKLIPVFQQATTESTYQLALFQLVAHIQDGHGFMESLNPGRCLRCDLGRLWLPFEVQLLGNKAVVTQLYNDSLTLPPWLMVGTVISHIDGETIGERIDRLRPYVSASTPQALLRDLTPLFRVGTQAAKLTLDLTGRDTIVTVARYPHAKLGRNRAAYTSARYPVSSWLAGGVGYVNIGKLSQKQVDSVMTALLPAKAIMFDLRGYPQQTVYSVGRYLVNKLTPFARFTRPDMRFPGAFQWAVTTKLSPLQSPKPYQGKVVILIDESTQSQAEFTAMAFGTHAQATFVGRPTAGADGDIVWVPLPGGYRTAFSGLGVYYPDGRETQRIGIAPDVMVEPTVEGIRQGHDEVLERALKLIQVGK